jgi:hypothetical protein
MRKNNRSHQTQWAAQFAVASELCKQDYEVSLTLGHSAPVADIVAISPERRETIYIDVKGLHRRNAWLVKPKRPRKNLFYILVLVPRNAPNRYFVFSQKEINRKIDAELSRLDRSTDYPIKGIPWSAALIQEDAWHKMPR